MVCKKFWAQFLFGTKIKTSYQKVLPIIESLDLRAKLGVSGFILLLGRLIWYSVLIQDLTECRNHYFIDRAQNLGLEKVTDFDDFHFDEYPSRTSQMTSIYDKVNICAGGDGFDSCVVRKIKNQWNKYPSLGL